MDAEDTRSASPASGARPDLGGRGLSYEVLTLQWNVDIHNLLLTATGKGDKQRTIPFSFEHRRYLWRYQSKANPDLVFPSRSDEVLSRCCGM